MSLPQIALIGTGGTIAGAAAQATSTTRYQPASLGIQAVVQSVPELQARYRLQFFQPMQLGSYDVPQHIGVNCMRWSPRRWPTPKPKAP